MKALELPFKYERVYDSEKAEFTCWRVSPVIFGGKPNLPRTDEEIIESVREEKENEQWYTTPYWRRKRLPNEQLEIVVAGNQIQLYNYAQPLEARHLSELKLVLSVMGNKFPGDLTRVSYILINNDQPLSHLGDADLYPANGMSYQHWKTFELYPRCMGMIPYRVPPVNILTGVLAHEFTHFLQQIFESSWAENFQWLNCEDFPEEWAHKPSPDGTGYRYYHNQTDEMAPQRRFPIQPEQCVSFYAKQNMHEDICESMVAYLFNPMLLQQVSPLKYEIISGHDQRKAHADVKISIVPSNRIALPQVKPQTITYFIIES